MEKEKKVVVYIDGSSVDVNAKKKGVSAEWHGSYAGVFYVDGMEVMRMRGYEKGGTIGKMELMALVEVFNYCQGKYEDIDIYSDSQYVVKGSMIWIDGWIKKKFKGIKHPELWKKYNSLRGRNLMVMWNKGHSGIAGNELADKLANEALGAGITGWRVSGKESFLLFETTEINEFSMPQEYSKSEYIQQALQSGKIKLDEAMELMNDDNEFTDMTKKKKESEKFFSINNSQGWTSECQKKEYDKMDKQLKETERRLWFPDDNDFTDMAKKKKEKVYLTWYEEQLAIHRKMIEKQTEEFNRMMDRYAKHVEGLIHQLKTETEKIKK